ncbi:MAG: ATP-binding cassette domain-containing protein, partial [Dehalococcoidia bacterium]
MSAETTSLAIETHALTRRYAGVDVVREVAVQVPAGRKVALVGSNGAGKTTLLSILSTLV